MRLMSENYQDFLEKWYMGQSTGYTGNPLSQEEARKKALEEIPEPYYNPKHNTTKREIYNKLGQLEDIEELCEKVVEKPIYEKFIDTHEIHKEDYTECCALYSFKHNRIELYMYDFVNYLELDKYGKTWALTKEELL